MLFRVASSWLALQLCAGAAAAQPATQATAEQLELARQLFREAAELERQRQWLAAEQKLEQAIAIKDTPGLRYHLAYSRAKLGRLLAAAADYARAEQMIAEGASAPDVEPLLAAARADALARIPVVSVELVPSVENASLAIDGQAVTLEAARSGISLDPGSHEITVTAQGYHPVTGTFALQERQKRSLRLELKSASRAPAAAEPAFTHTSGTNLQGPERSSSSTLRTWVLVSEATVTVAGLALGAWGLHSRSQAEDRMKRLNTEIEVGEPQRPVGQQCSPPSSVAKQCEQLHDAQQDVIQGRNLATAGFVTASVGAVAFGATWLLWPSAPARAWITLSPRGSVAVVGGTF